MIALSVSNEFKARRNEVFKRSQKAAFLFPGAHEAERNADVSYPYRQDSNFFYLTGFEEQGAFLVLTASQKTVLFVMPRDVEREIWEGERYGIDRAKSIFSIDEVYLIHELKDRLPELLKGAEKVFYKLGDIHNDSTVISSMKAAQKALGRTGRAMAPLHDPNEVLGEMRLFKSDSEIASLRRACSVSGLAHKQLMSTLRPGQNEFEVETELYNQFRKGGAKRLGYDSIVAGGKNATCLHYRGNNEVLNKDDLLLIDAGGEVDYYTADITRTFPMGMTYSAEQRLIYEIVLKAQKDCCAMVRPGVRYHDIHRKAVDVMVDGLIAAKLLNGSRDEIISKGLFRQFYPHSTGHWLGMDVHDLGLYYEKGGTTFEFSRPLEAGMVFTIEPGLYVQPNDEKAPTSFRGIGIRIEDDILVTANGSENLTVSAPKEISEIEACRRMALG